MKNKDLEIWKAARTLAVEIHFMTMKELPSFEMYETGSQIRRSIKSVAANIVEGCGRRRYKMDFERERQIQSTASTVRSVRKNVKQVYFKSLY